MNTSLERRLRLSNCELEKICGLVPRPISAARALWNRRINLAGQRHLTKWAKVAKTVLQVQ